MFSLDGIYINSFDIDTICNRHVNIAHAYFE